MKNKLIAIILGLLLSLPVGAATYGPVGSNETLWSIASRTRPSYDVSVQQMMLTIRMKNPQAFTTKNINSLQKGAVLQLPTLSELQQLDRVQALRTARIHNQTWNGPTAAKVATKVSGRKTKASTTPTRLSKARATQVQLQREISGLKTQLRQEQQRSQKLAAEVKRLEANGGKFASASPSPETGRLQAELTDLKSVLADKDNHIKNLQASLKEASEAIKRQHSENLALYEQLKAVDPDSATQKTAAPANGKSELKLAGVGEEQAQLMQDGKPVAFTDQLPAQRPQTTSQAAMPPAESSDTGKSNGVPLKNFLEPQGDDAALRSNDQKPSPSLDSGSTKQQPVEPGAFKAPSRISLVIALISLLFILALLWRAFSQQRASKRAAEARQREEAALRVQNIDNNKDRPVRPDGRQEPEIVL